MEKKPNRDAIALVDARAHEKALADELCELRRRIKASDAEIAVHVAALSKGVGPNRRRVLHILPEDRAVLVEWKDEEHTAVAVFNNE